MSKPIFVVRIPLLHNYSEDYFQQLQKYISDRLQDYHILILKDHSTERVEFECYNGVDHEDDFERLKELTTSAKTFDA